MTTYLRNAWYVAAQSSELTTTPLKRTLLEERCALFRTESGEVAILLDRCPHRFAPLSCGKVRAEVLTCGYHGLAFDRSGQCVANPHGPVPRAARVRSYPCFERYGYVWFWPGDPTKADPKALPAFPYLEDPTHFSVVKTYLHVKANYQLVVDNLLDLSHVPFLHPNFAVEGVSTQKDLGQTMTRVKRESDRVLSRRVRSGLPPNKPAREIFGFGPEPVDMRSHMTWFPPALLDFDLGTCLTGTSEAQGLCLPAAHYVTPETELTCHYFVSAARNMRRDDPEVDRHIAGVMDTAFRLQDEPMIEAVQECMGPTGDLDSMQPLLLQTDGAPVEARRMLGSLIATEQAG